MLMVKGERLSAERYNNGLYSIQLQCNASSCDAKKDLKGNVLWLAVDCKRKEGGNTQQ